VIQGAPCPIDVPAALGRCPGLLAELGLRRSSSSTGGSAGAGSGELILVVQPPQAQRRLGLTNRGGIHSLPSDDWIWAASRWNLMERGVGVAGVATRGNRPGVADAWSPTFKGSRAWRSLC